MKEPESFYYWDYPSYSYCRGVYDAMITSWFWLLANFALIVAFFTFIPFVEKRDVGSVYTRNGLIPLIAAMNFASQVMVFHVHYYYGNYCYPTCCKLRKASYGLAITILILSIFAFVDLVVDNSKKSAPVPINAVVPVQSSHVEYIEEPGHYNYVQKAPTQDVYHHPNGAVTVNPPQYHDPIPVYQKGKVKEVVVVTENYVVTPVNQGNSSSGTDMFTITHIALVALNILFTCLIIAFLSDCICSTGTFLVFLASEMFYLYL